jgi:hypothetical protein
METNHLRNHAESPADIAHETHDALEKLGGEPSVDNLEIMAREMDIPTEHVGVNDTRSVMVSEQGEALITTSKLNGCHTTLVVSADRETGQHKLTLMHYMAEAGSIYGRAVDAVLSDVDSKPNLMVSLMSERTVSPDPGIDDRAEAVGIVNHHMSYQARRNPERQARADRGEFGGVLYQDEGGNSRLYVATDSGDQEFIVPTT